MGFTTSGFEASEVSRGPGGLSRGILVRTFRGGGLRRLRCRALFCGSAGP